MRLYKLYDYIEGELRTFKKKNEKNDTPSETKVVNDAVIYALSTIKGKLNKVFCKECEFCKRTLTKNSRFCSFCGKEQPLTRFNLIDGDNVWIFGYKDKWYKVKFHGYCDFDGYIFATSESKPKFLPYYSKSNWKLESEYEVFSK